jgi:hypothetical protein
MESINYHGLEYNDLIALKSQLQTEIENLNKSKLETVRVLNKDHKFLKALESYIQQTFCWQVDTLFVGE